MRIGRATYYFFLSANYFFLYANYFFLYTMREHSWQKM